jgi:predicted RNase H-like HicB family nuclease
MAMTYTVTAFWDDDAKVWVATSDDVPGLVTEARTLDALVERVHAVTPELLDDNAHLIEGGRDADEKIDIHVVSRQSSAPRPASLIR